MPTPDPIALPELPKSLDSVRVMARGVPESARPHGHYYNVEQLRAYGQACVEALAPAPQVPGDMVLVPREPTGDMLDAMIEPWLRGAGTERECLVAGWKGALSAAPSTPPLNELLGQREEFNLNEVSGNSGQLASLEQRARELLASRDHNSECHFWQQDGGEETCDCGLTELRAITAALSAQPRGVYADCCDTPSYCSSVRRCTRKDVAPQPREVRGVDGWSRADIADLRDRLVSSAISKCMEGTSKKASDYQFIRAAITEAAGLLESLLATTPQDAAGVEPAAWMATSKPSSDGTVAIQFTNNIDYANQCRRADWTVTPLYTTPPPGVDVAALRQIAGELRDNAHHHQQEDRAVGIFADEQEAQFNTELAERIERALSAIDDAAPGVQP